LSNKLFDLKSAIYFIIYKNHRADRGFFIQNNINSIKLIIKNMSKKFAWSQKYSVNVEELDKQHKEWINICNSLIDLAETASFTNEEALIKVMQLGDYALYHLSAEEELFNKTKYPDASSHIEIHNQFREKSKDFINQVRGKKIDTKKIIGEIAAFTIEWLLNHILITDKKYSEFFNQHGVK